MVFDYYTYTCDEHIKGEADLEYFIDQHKDFIIERYAEAWSLDIDKVKLDEISDDFIVKVKEDYESKHNFWEDLL